MGMHAVPTADVDRKETFQASMIVGYNIGQPIFFESMISKALLMKKESFDLPMPGVPGLHARRHRSSTPSMTRKNRNTG